MPFKSKQQMRYLYGQHPKIAKKWHDETKASGGKFPKNKYVKKKKKTKKKKK